MVMARRCEKNKASELEREKAIYAMKIESIRGVFQFGGAALKSSILING